MVEDYKNYVDTLDDEIYESSFEHIKPKQYFADEFKFTKADTDPRDSDSERLFSYNNFTPFPWQDAVFQDLERTKAKNSFLVLPRRAGKTTFACVYIVKKALEKAMTTRLPFIQYGIAFQELSSGKAVVWKELLLRTEGLPKRAPNSQGGWIDFSVVNEQGIHVSVRIRIIGLKNIHGKRGLFFDGLVVDERGFIMEGWRPIILPTLKDEVRQPTWLMMIGTPADEGDFWKDYDYIKKQMDLGIEGFYALYTNYNKLRHLKPDDYEELKQTLSNEEFQREINCLRGSITGANYFTEELKALDRENRILSIPSDRTQKKILVADIAGSQAKADAFAIWVCQFNQSTGRVQFIDYVEFRSPRPEDIGNWVVQKRYLVSQVILPWDGEKGFGTNTRQELEKVLPGSEVLCLSRTSKLAGIITARRFLSKCEFDESNTTQGLMCLRKHAKKFDKDKRIYLMDPKHDAYVHGVDAFRYSAEAYSQGKMRFDVDFGQENYLNSTSTKIENYDPMSTLNGER